MTHPSLTSLARRAIGAAAAIACAAGVLAPASDAQAQYTTTRITAGLALPLFVTAPPSDYNRIFVVEQRSGSTGRIRVIDINTNTLIGTPFLSISPVATGNEQGLLGLAFHPDFLNNGYFFVNYNNSSGTTIIARYQANAPYATSNTANPASATTLLTISQPFSNHNGGWIGFGPDGNLYIATGDGGSGNDPQGNGQNINSLLGKMLRIDVDGADNIPGNDDDDGVVGNGGAQYTNPASNPFAGATPGLDQIYFTGLRNPWRNSFDRLTGDFYIGDVGQNAIEEIDFVHADTPATPVKNFGWRCMEGNNCTGLSGCTCNATTLTRPIWTYTHSFGCSITGGVNYRGCAIPALNGTYFFADYCTSRIWSFNYDRSGNPVAAVTDRTTQLAPGGGLSINSITSFGEDALGEIYICDQGGEIFKIVPTSIVDCNFNGRPDACEIALDPKLDSDNDGVLDSCETSACCVDGKCSQVSEATCAALGGSWLGLNRSCTEPGICTPPSCPCDWNSDSTLTSQDFFDFLTGFFANDADFNQDSVTNSQDFFDFLACFFTPPPGC